MIIYDIIRNFIQDQTSATVCCAGNEPYCFSCFYAFESESGMLYFKSSENSTHSRLLRNNPLVAGTILPDRLNRIFVKGIQFKGLATVPAELTRHASGFYYRKHPVALAVPGEIWGIQLVHIKMTDSSGGFMKKVIWTRENLPEKISAKEE